MEVRRAVAGDVPALVSLLRRSWLTGWAPRLRPETVHRFEATDPSRHYATTRWREFVVAESDGRLLGMFHVEGNVLNAIHVDPECKGQGIGSALMEEAERRIAKDHPEARLEVLVFNKGAMAFYSARGWMLGRSWQGEECGEAVETFEMRKSL